MEGNPLDSRRAVLEARRASLVDEEARLLGQVPEMDPLVAARALRRLADEMEGLERDFEDLLQEELKAREARHGGTSEEG